MKILLVDDHPLVCEGVASLLRQLDAAVQLVPASDVSSGLRLVREHGDIELLMLDIGLPEIDGMAAIELFRQAAPSMPIVILTAADDQNTVAEALRRGVQGFIPKSVDAQVMLNGLRTVLDGDLFVPDASAPPSGHGDLTSRQIEVLRLLVQGMSNKEIARAMGLSSGTVRIHLAAIFKVLGVSNRTEAAMAAMRRRILPD